MCAPARAGAVITLLAAASTTVSAQVPAWTVSEVRRIGPPAVEFGAVSDAAIDAGDRLWIVDGMAGELYVEEAGGLRRVAGPGEGPGELTPGALEVVVLRGDTIVVVEPPELRLHRFAPDGSYIDTSIFTGEQNMTIGWRLLSDGRLAARLLPATVPMPNAPPPGSGNPVRAFDARGRAGDVLAMLPPTESFRMGDGPLPIITLLAPQPLWDVDGRGRVLVASTHAYEVRAHGAGSSTTVVVRDVEPERVSRELAAAARERLRELLRARRSPPAMVEQTVARAVVADRAPVIGGLMAGPDGTLWIREPARTSEELVDILHPGGRAWRVYDARGRAIASATMPPRFEPLEWRGDLLVGIARDEVGQTSALVLRVSR